ncbi:protein of unknown function [Chryseobacterium arachidis]|uniref:Uncharacterized protein n=1 Tax=Chryseobacterium arachidis TaxID=1416778 RepID=A0A1M5IE98_9FLAO|nr:DUF3872 domain-containing protein [Chryseobacterium arachidis]SHG26230.1 protein of unknown function [Chryseobacterium arachidis]
MKNVIDNSKKGLYSLWYGVAAMLFILSCYSCEKDNLDVQEVFPFEVKVMPVPKEIGTGETVEIRITIVSNGNYNGNQFYIRYFQNEGDGSLRQLPLKPYLPNDLYPLLDREFRLYYLSKSIVSQNFDVWIVDGFGNEKQLNFQFNNKKLTPPIR